MAFDTLKRLLPTSGSVRWKSGDRPSIIAREVHNASKEFGNCKSTEKLGYICENINALWLHIFNIEQSMAPQKKIELAEELIIRPDIMKNTVAIFNNVPMHIQKKIKDIVNFIIVWCSNEAEESPYVRAHFNVKIKNQLFHCKHQLPAIIARGYNEAGSLRIYNDLIRHFLLDDLCLDYILDDNGYGEDGWRDRPYGCIWYLFDRLSPRSRRHANQNQFDLVHGTLSLIETLIFETNRITMREFLEKEWEKLIELFNKMLESENFLIRIKGMQFLYNIVTGGGNYKLRDWYLMRTDNLKAVCLNMELKNKEVRLAAIKLFEIFLDNTENVPTVDDFILANRNRLISFFGDISPIHYYSGGYEELEDARYAKIIHKLFQFGYARPLTKRQMQVFKADELFQKKILEEQTVETRFLGDEEYTDPTVRHVYNLRFPLHIPPLRNGTILGKFGN